MPVTQKRQFFVRLQDGSRPDQAMLSIKVIDQANKDDYPMHFAYNEKRKSATMTFAGRHAIVDMVNTIDDLLMLISSKIQIPTDGQIAEQMKARMLHGETIFVIDRQAKTLLV